MSRKTIFLIVLVFAILAALTIAGMSDGSDHAQHLAGWTWGDGFANGGSGV